MRPLNFGNQNCTISALFALFAPTLAFLQNPTLANQALARKTAPRQNVTVLAQEALSTSC